MSDATRVRDKKSKKDKKSTKNIKPRHVTSYEGTRISSPTFSVAPEEVAQKRKELGLARGPTENRGRNKKALARSKSLTGLLRDPDKLERLSTNLTLNFVENQVGKKKAHAAELGTTISGKEVLQWIQSSGHASTTEKALKVAKELLEAEAIVPTNLSNPDLSSGKIFSTENMYTVSYPLFKENFTVSGRFPPFLCSEADCFLINNDKTKLDTFIKRIPKSSESASKCIRNEANLLSRMSTTGGPALKSLSQSSSSLVMQQEYFSGGNLFARMASEDKIPERIVLNIIFQLASLLSLYHEKGCAFGMLNLLSIYVRGDEPLSERTQVYLIDNGKLAEQNSEMSQHITLFTAPELMCNNSKLTDKADMWSLGVCFYWLLFGGPPYICSDLTQLKALTSTSPVLSTGSKHTFSISPPSRIILLQLLNPDPDRRPTSSELMSWPRTDNSELEQVLLYPYAIWRSFLSMRHVYPTDSDVVTEVKSRERFRSFLGLSKKVSVIPTLHEVEVAFCSDKLRFTNSFVKSLVTPTTIDNIPLYNCVDIEGIPTRLHVLNIRNLNTWNTERIVTSHLYYIVNLKEVDADGLLSDNFGLSKSIKMFESLYLQDYFYDKIRSNLYNVPITIIFINCSHLETLNNINPTPRKKDNLKSSKPGVVVKAFHEHLQKVFCSIKNRSPVPRVIKAKFIENDSPEEIYELLKEHCVNHATRTESRDADSIIKRVIQLKLNRVNIQFLYPLSKSKPLQQLLPLAEHLHSIGSSVREVNMTNLSMKEKEFSEFITQSLSGNTTLTSLNISYNSIGDAGLESLCKVLKKNETLEKLILIHVGLTSAGVIYLSNILSTMSGLSLLDVSRNNIGDAGVVALAEKLFANRSLKSLYLQECGFYEAGFLSLCSILEINTLRHLDIAGNIIPNYLSDNLLKSLRNGLLSTPLTIIFPSHFNAKVPEHFLKQRSNTWKIRKANKYKSGDIGEFICTISQKSVNKVDLSNLALPNFEIPKNNWRDISNIIILNLSHNNLTKFPDSLIELKSLKSLSLAFNNIISLGKIGNLKTLERLILCGNKLEKISGIDQLTNLRYLDARWNNLRGLPDFADHLNLEHLLLDCNNLLKVHTPLLKLRHLRDLSVTNNKINPIKSIIYRAWSRDIRIINLSHSLMNYLPKEIGLLYFLVELDLSYNKLTCLPPHIKNLASLRILRLDHNQFTESSLYPLISLDLSLISLSGNDLLPHSWTNSVLSFNSFKELIPLEYRSKEKRTIELHRAKLMLVGKSGVGKTIVSNMLRENPKQRKKTGQILKNKSFDRPSDGIHVEEWIADSKSSPQAILTVWDMAGTDVYKTTHAFFLEERSLFLLVFNLSIPETKQDIHYWLQMITSSSPNSPVLLVGTHADLLDPESIADVGNKMIQKYSNRFSNITNFVSICSFESIDIETLHDTILTSLRSQNYITKKVPEGYETLISLIKAERNLCNPPFASMAEFEEMVLECGIESSSHTVAEYLNLLGVVSYFNEKKLGVSSAIMLDPSWLISLISTIITSRDNGIEKGILYHSHLPKLWASYPKSLYPFLITLFNQIEILFTAKEPHPEKGVYSLIPSTFSTQKLGAQSVFIPIDDFLALGLGVQLERIYQFDFLPFGFFSRLVVRLLHFTNPTYYWRTGLVCESGENSGLVEFEMGRELSVKVRGKNPAKLLRVIVENIDLLLSGWYRNKATVIVPFVSKGLHRVHIDYQFALEELEEAAAFGKTEIDFKTGNETIPVRIDSIAPDLVMADISEMLMKWEDMEVEKIIGQGAFGKVYSAVYKGNRVAVKQIEVEQNMKVEAYAEFRREVALCAELQNPAIVALRGVCLDPWALALEFMPHGDLYTFLNDHKNVITWKMRIRMAKNIAEAIRFLHSFQPKIIHRDLKSPNCLVCF